jgi:hypothetical protein
MDPNGSLIQHVISTIEGLQRSQIKDGELLIPNGRISVPDSLYHLSGITAYPLIVPKIKSLSTGAATKTTASTAPSGDLVEIEWLCTRRTPTERHYIARFEVTTAELRYAKTGSRWTLESAEYSEREFVQRWNRIPRR